MIQMSKTQHAAYLKAGVMRETYTHSYEDGTGFTVDVTDMRRQLSRKLPPGFIATIHHEDFIEALRAGRIFEEERLNTLTAADLEEPVIVMVIPEPNGQESHLIIDGVHRIMRRHRDGLRETRAWIVPQDRFREPPTAAEGFHMITDWGDETIVNGKRVAM